MKLSVCIPYKARLDNLKIALEALARQTMHADDFEVIIGAMEYSVELIAATSVFCDRLNIVTVCSSREFDIPRARNLAMRSATGDVVVQMDADTMLHPDALQRLDDRCFAFGQRVCAVGQVVGYGNNQDGDVESVELRPYHEHLAALQEMAASPDWPADPRFRVAHNIPWAFAWTGLIALPRAVVAAEQLYFDESFRGLTRVFGDTGANGLWPQYRADLAHASGAVAFGVAVGMARGSITLRVGVPLDGADNPVDREHLSLFDVPADVKILPLTGLSLPYEAGEVASCRIDARIQRLPPRYRDAVLAEAERVSRHVVADDR